MRRIRKGGLLLIGVQVVLWVGALMVVVPVVWMLSTSLKPLAEVFTFPPTLFGSEILWENYLRIADRFPFDKLFLNSLKISVIIVTSQLFTSSLAGFTFARLRFRGRDALFALYLATMIVPFHVTLIPTFVLMRHFGWIDTHYSLIVPNLVSIFGTFLMRQFFLTIPRDLEDAAKIDGCSPFRVYWNIFLPLAKPAMATLGVFTFMWSWNDFMRPLVYINTIPKMTLPLGLAAMQGLYATDWPVLMAGITISMLPVLVVFIFAQEFFVRGITLSGLKG